VKLVCHLVGAVYDGVRQAGLGGYVAGVAGRRVALHQLVQEHQLLAIVQALQRLQGNTGPAGGYDVYRATLGDCVIKGQLRAFFKNLIKLILYQSADYSVQ